MKKADEAKINKVLSDLWQKNLPTLRERLDLLDRTAELASSGDVPEASRVEALNIAHKLAGSLGMFGYNEGTDIARQLESILRSPTAKTLPGIPALTRHLRKSIFPDD